MSIPDEAVEAAHKAWREQAAQEGSIFEYNLRAALEAAAPHLMAEAQAKAYDKGYTHGREDGSMSHFSLSQRAAKSRKNPYRKATP
jgi:flagellar biosynthesis/type III secretory pathway protein FliH